MSNSATLEPLVRAVQTHEDGLWDWRRADDHLWGAERFWKLLGLTPQDDYKASDWFERAHPSDTELLLDLLEQAKQDCRPLTLDCRFWTGSGEYRWFKIMASVSQESEQGPTHLSGWIRDVHQQRIEEEIAQLREAAFRQRQRMVAVDCLAGGIAHEFNNVLQIVYGYATFAKETLGPQSEVNEDLDQILQAAERATSLTRRLQEYSRVEDEADQTIDLREVLLDLEALLRPVLDEKIELVVDTEAMDMTAMGIAGSLRQLLLNLCINARDALPEGGGLWVRAERFVTKSHRDEIGWGLAPGAYCRIWVSDSGTGIPEQNLERIFEPFFSTKEIAQGAGLGLAVVRGVVERLRGAITVNSKEGVGTSFAVYIPIEEKLPPTSLDSKAMQTEEPPEHRSTLLFVEPAVGTVRSIEAELLEAGFDLFIARDCESAALLCEKQGPIDYAVVDASLYPCAVAAFGDQIKRKLLVSTRFDPKTMLSSELPFTSDLTVCAEPYDVTTLQTAMEVDSSPVAEAMPDMCSVGALPERTLQ